MIPKFNEMFTTYGAWELTCQPCRMPPMIRPPVLPTIRIGAYALVIMASGRLSSNPKTRPIAQPGQNGSCTQAITNPMANRLANAAKSAVVLLGKDIGNIIATETAPKMIPLRTPEIMGCI